MSRLVLAKQILRMCVHTTGRVFGLTCVPRTALPLSTGMYICIYIHKHEDFKYNPVLLSLGQQQCIQQHIRVMLLLISRHHACLPNT